MNPLQEYDFKLMSEIHPVPKLMKYQEDISRIIYADYLEWLIKQSKIRDYFQENPSLP